MSLFDKWHIADPPPDHEDQAAAAFLRRRSGNWSADDQAANEARLAENPTFADAVLRVERAWRITGDHAAAPELMALRQLALSRACRASARRWLSPGGRLQRRWLGAAAIAAIAIALGMVLQRSPSGYGSATYQTGIGEQRVVELPDNSRIALDVVTCLRVRYSVDARVVELAEGRAQFSVARDPKRPFRVEAGANTILAIGTSFTVEYVDKEIHVALLEGKVAVSIATTPTKPAAAQDTRAPQAPIQARTFELTSGEALWVRPDGQTVVTPCADLEAATAWRQGKIIFRGEPLGEAVRRLNRYSRFQLEIEDARLMEVLVSGVFEAGDTPAFVEAVQLYLPVTADYSQPGVVHLRPR